MNNADIARLQAAKRRADAAAEQAAVARVTLTSKISASRQARTDLAAAIRKARQTGATYVEVAAVIGMTPQGVKAIVDRHGDHSTSA